MKKYYFFSASKLKFIEIKNYRRKFISLVVLISSLISFFIFAIYFIINVTINPNSQLKQVISENKILKNKLVNLKDNLIYFSDKFDSLSLINNELRLANNLEPITVADRNIGIGGAIFSASNISTNSELNEVISTLDNYVQMIETKIILENKNYKEIENTIEYNNKLFEAIPAIKPTLGSYGDRFGMRYHPILKIKRMHNGIDFLAYYNSPVYAPGGGTIEFSGRNGGLGKSITINHGFGYKTVFGHLNKLKVKKGQKVKRGDLIGLTGSSGSLSTGPHLHYEVKHNGIALNPRNFIFDDVKIFDLAQNLEKE